MRGLALVEFLADDPFRQYRTEWFPFVQGLGRACGVDVRWLTLRAGAASRLPSNYYVVEPPPADVARLVAALRDAAPGTVLVNDRPGPRLAAALAEALPSARVLVAGDDTSRYDEPRVDEARAWLGLPPEADPTTGAALLSDRADPDYGASTLNADDRGWPTLTWLKAGLGCTYARPLATNPHFRGVPLDTVERTAGCSFCQGPYHGAGDARRARPRTPAVELTVRQLRRYLETAPPERRTFHFVVDSADVFAHVSDFFEQALALGLPPTAFRFARRADDVLARADDLERWLPRLAEGGHRLLLWCMGVESFSKVENERLNKGVAPEVYEAALARIGTWEKRWPQVVPFSEDGGPSMILFGPWTTLDDLADNVAAGRRLGLDAPFLYTTRLSLIPGTAIAELARRDGLLAPAFVEPFLVIDCPLVFWDLRELPWRFAHPEVDGVFRLLIRLTDRTLSTDPAYVPAADPLWVALAPLRERLERGRLGFLDAFQALLEAARAEPQAGPGAVVEALLRRLGADDAPIPTTEARVSAAPGGRSPAPGPSPRFVAALDQALGGLAAQDGAGLSAQRGGEGGDGMGAFVRVDLTTPGGPVELRVYEGGDGGRAFVAGRGCRLVHAPATPVTSPGQANAIRRLAGLLDEALERPGSPARG
jgi:hypothetical protein